jgi:hypothetical protein
VTCNVGLSVCLYSSRRLKRTMKSRFHLPLVKCLQMQLVSLFKQTYKKRVADETAELIVIHTSSGRGNHATAFSDNSMFC